MSILADSNSAHSDFDEQVDVITNSKEEIDAMINSEEQVDSIRDSEELVDAVSDPKSNPSINKKVATHTANRNFAQKLLKNRFIPKIIQGAICPIDQLITEYVPLIRETLGRCQTVSLSLN